MDQYTVIGAFIALDYTDLFKNATTESKGNYIFH